MQTRIAQALKILGRKTGIHGMLGGQGVDVENDGKPLTREMLDYIYENKTSALIECAMMIGAVLAGASKEDTEKIEQAAGRIGIAFQIRDDILDVTGSTKELGKAVGSDEKNNKTTYVTLEGIEKAGEKVRILTEEAIGLLQELPGEKEFLTELLIPPENFPQLAQEIRGFLLEHLSRTGGHLASNLGAVELTMALHYVFDLPKDKIIWDVGHQSYTHKILTGRKEGFDELRKFGGLSGFPKRSESSCDAYDTGHSSTSISAGVGYVSARDLKKEDYRVVSVIGDGALTGGLAYEALNNAAQLKKNFIIVLNDNKMSISENVGGISQYLSNLRTAESYTGLKTEVKRTLNKVPGIGPAMVQRIHKTKDSIKQLIIPGMFFEDMGIKYLGPISGHDCGRMIQVLNEARKVEGPVLVHVLTEKGRGYEPAMRHPARFHGTAAFDLEHGIPLANSGKANYTDIFSTVMRKFGDREERVVAVTAAMPDGTGLKRFRNMFPERFF